MIGALQSSKKPGSDLKILFLKIIIFPTGQLF